MRKLKFLLKILVASQLLLIAVYFLVTGTVPMVAVIVESQNITKIINGTIVEQLPSVNQVKLRIISNSYTGKNATRSNGLDFVSTRVSSVVPKDYHNNTTIDKFTTTTVHNHTVKPLSVRTITTTTKPRAHLTAIAIGMGITTRKVIKVFWEDISKSGLQFLSGFLVSFCRTASPGFDYRFYLAYDYSDTFFNDVSFRKNLSTMLRNHVSSKYSGCSSASNYSVRYVECPYQGKPAWAQNDAMIAAYVEGAEYFFRVNDDTLLLSKRWTETYIQVLNNYMPPNVGVVGPNHKGGNQAILTYDFVHRSHIDIFGLYYPRIFPSWYGDLWITKIYLPGRMTKVKNMILKHTMKLGRRYRVYKPLPKQQQIQKINADKDILIRYVRAAEGSAIAPKPDKIISMVILKNNSDWLWGVIRNAQLRSIFFPDWTLRVYVPANYQHNKENDISKDIYSPKTTLIDVGSTLEMLKTLHVDVTYVNSSLLSPKVPPSLWNLLAVDIPGAAYVLLRQPEMRLSQRDATAVANWLESPNAHKAVHCMRDHPRHADTALVPGLWAINTSAVKDILQGQSMQLLLKTASETSSSNRASVEVESGIYNHMWNLFKNHSMCHDSVSCTRWPNSVSFPLPRQKGDFVGKLYTAFEPITTDITPLFSTHASCVSNI